MEYKKIIDLLDDTMNQTSKFKTRNWNKKNNESPGVYTSTSTSTSTTTTTTTTNSITFKTSLIRSNLYDYNYAYMFFKGTITVLWQ